jgi:hypothetical protein
MLNTTEAQKMKASSRQSGPDMTPDPIATNKALRKSQQNGALAFGYSFRDTYAPIEPAMAVNCI